MTMIIILSLAVKKRSGIANAFVFLNGSQLSSLFGTLSLLTGSGSLSIITVRWYSMMLMYVYVNVLF